MLTGIPLIGGGKLVTRRGLDGIITLITLILVVSVAYYMTAVKSVNLDIPLAAMLVLIVILAIAAYATRGSADGSTKVQTSANQS